MTPARVGAVVDAVAAAQPDLVLLLGDYLDSTWLGRGRARPEDVAARLARLPNPVAVLGNHDWRAVGAGMWLALEAAGIPVLENAARPVAPGLWVGGTAEYRFRAPDLRATLAGVPPDAAVLLMIHDPDLFPWVPPRVALTVAGHLHGGQVNLPVLRRAMLPTRYGDRYLAGLVVEGGRHLYVSAGLGTSGLPVRFRRPPEVPLLRLVARARQFAVRLIPAGLASPALLITALQRRWTPRTRPASGCPAFSLGVPPLQKAIGGVRRKQSGKGLKAGAPRTDEGEDRPWSS